MSEETGIEKEEKSLEDIRKKAEERTCPVQKVLYLVEEFLAGPMCGRCFPCSLGSYEARIRLIRIGQHLEDVSSQDIAVLKRIGSQMFVASFCKKGRDVGKFITETLESSPDEFDLHLAAICHSKECTGVVEYIINPDLCVMCGRCSEVCKYDAVAGEKREGYRSGHIPFEIRQKKCTRCGECIKVCPTGAIELITTEVDSPVSNLQHQT